MSELERDPQTGAAILPLPSREELEKIIELVRQAASGYTRTPAHEEAITLWIAGYSDYAKALRAGVPRKYWPARLDPDDGAAARRALRYVAEELDQGRALALLGPPSLGKTWLAAGILAEVNRGARMHQRRGRFCYVPSIAHQLDDFDTVDETLADLTEEPLLVLDDLGAEHLRPDSMLEANWDEVIAVREAEVLPTIITSNLDAGDFRERYGDRAWARLGSVQWGAIYHVKGHDRRRPR